MEPLGKTPRAPRSLQDTGHSGLDYLLPLVALESFIWKGSIVLIDISTYFSVAIKYPEGGGSWPLPVGAAAPSLIHHHTSQLLGTH